MNTATDMELVKHWQDEKTRLEDNPSAVRRPEKRREELTRLIEGAFRGHFGFTKSRSAHNFFLDCGILQSRYSCYFDHCWFYKKPTENGVAFLITSQPYGFDSKARAKIELQAKQWGATFINTSEWSWWYPGHTSSFTLCFPRSTVDRLRKERRGRL